MAAKYTKQTPQEARDWLGGTSLAFPHEWTLDKVAETSRGLNQTKKWTGVEASRAIAHWGAHKLATCPDFKAPHWDWLTATGSYSPMDLYNRLIRILEPAVGEGEGWRTTNAAKSKLLEDIQKRVLELLALIEVEGRLNVDFADVVGLRPEMQPLLDRASEITRGRMLQIQSWNWDGRSGPMPIAEHPGFYGGPRLSDYLAALVTKIAGDGQRAYPSLRSIVPDESDRGVDDDLEVDESELEIDPQVMSRLLGFKQSGPLDPELLREGGDFGGAPARPDSLLNAVIKAFPGPLFDRYVAPPNVPPASAIEAACLAWFGKSPTQKEINAKIRDSRARLEPQMVRAIAAAEKIEALRSVWKADGVADDEIRRKLFNTFLDEE